jgi:hypothetical protein
MSHQIIKKWRYAMSQRERNKRMRWMYFVTCSEVSQMRLMRAYYWMRMKGIELRFKRSHGFSKPYCGGRVYKNLSM